MLVNSSMIPLQTVFFNTEGAYMPSNRPSDRDENRSSDEKSRRIAESAIEAERQRHLQADRAIGETYYLPERPVKPPKDEK